MVVTASSGLMSYDYGLHFRDRLNCRRLCDMLNNESTTNEESVNCKPLKWLECGWLTSMYTDTFEGVEERFVIKSKPLKLIVADGLINLNITKEMTDGRTDVSWLGVAHEGTIVARQCDIEYIWTRRFHHQHSCHVVSRHIVSGPVVQRF